MKTLTIEFQDLGGLRMEFGAGHTDLNVCYDAAVKAYVQPYALGIQAGRVSEEKQLEIQMKAYACGVVMRTDPQMTEEEVFEWFREHPSEFATLFSYADHRENFDGDHHEHGNAGSEADPDQQAPR